MTATPHETFLAGGRKDLRFTRGNYWKALKRMMTWAFLQFNIIKLCGKMSAEEHRQKQRVQGAVSINTRVMY